jgi:uncharacterized DUF497 family protein
MRGDSDDDEPTGPALAGWLGRHMSLEFEWDRDKAASNQKKHGVSFKEAATVFGDPLAAIFDDEVHSEEEQREIIIGQSAKNRLLLVAFTERVGPSRHQTGA